jgi:hypothetical protein
MAGRSPQRKANQKWSEETIRRRGVRAVVAGLRLKKQYLGVSSKCAVRMEEAALLHAEVKRLASRNKALAKSIKRRMVQDRFMEKTASACTQWRDHRK